MNGGLCIGAESTCIVDAADGGRPLSHMCVWHSSMPAVSSDSTQHLTARARRRARLLDELAALVERYEMLLAYAAAEPGRTPVRRDSIRALSVRFPGALRELDGLGVDVIARRSARARELLERAETDPEPELPLWARCVVELTPRLREVLRIKRWLARRRAPRDGAEVGAALAAWYDRQPGGHDPAITPAPALELVEQVAAPPGGQVQRLAYEGAARALGLEVAELKRELYGAEATRGE